METAYQSVGRLLDQIRLVSHDNPAVQRASDQIWVLCSAYMEPDQSPCGEEYGLNKSRAKMFGLLRARKGKTVSREALLNVCDHQADSDPSLKMLDVHVHKIRHAIEGSGMMIETVYGAGYRLSSTP